MTSLKHSLHLFTLVILLTACSPTAEISDETGAKPKLASEQNAVKTSPLAKATPQAKGDTRIHVTMSCHRGTVPNTNLPSIPVDVYVVNIDKKFHDEFPNKLVTQENYNPFLQGTTGEDGFIDINLDEDRKYDISIAVMDKRYPNAIPSNYAWGKIKVQKGTTVHKNFVMTQAWCDKDREIRDIDPASYNIQINDFSGDYDDISIAGFGVKKRFYARENSAGAFKYYVNYRTNLNEKKRGVHLENGASSMVITNVQSLKHIKRICGTTRNVDMIIKSDGALGIKTYSGTVDNEIIECKQAYSTHYPYTYANDYDGISTPDIEPNIRHVDTKNSLQRTSCPEDIGAKVASAPVTYPGACLESVITHTNVFELDPSASKVFPWGKLHKYSYRYDLTKPEETKGKVPPTILP